MTDQEEVLIFNEQPEQDELDYEFRIILIQQKFNQAVDSASLSIDQSQMSERILSGIASFTLINEFFDKFDEKVAYPNEGHIKYDLGSDGVIVIVVETELLRDSVLKFVDEYLEGLKKSTETENMSGQQQQQQQQQQSQDDEDEGRGHAKKQKKK